MSALLRQRQLPQRDSPYQQLRRRSLAVSVAAPVASQPNSLTSSAAFDDTAVSHTPSAQEFVGAADDDEIVHRREASICTDTARYRRSTARFVA